MRELTLGGTEGGSRCLCGVQPLSQGTPCGLDREMKGQGGVRDQKKQRVVFRGEFY